MHAEDTEAFRSAIQTVSDHSRELIDLFNALLRISEIETHRIRDHFRRMDMVEVVDRVVDAFRPDIVARNLILSVEHEGAGHIEGDHRLLA